MGYYEQTIEDYKIACLELKDDDNFISFKKNPHYRIMLEGGPKVQGEYYLNEINNHVKKNIFYENLDKFLINDSIGSPDIYDFGTNLKCSITTLKYSFNILNILSLLDDFNVHNVVEIGPGYGGLSLILDNLLCLNSVIFIDLDEANLLTKRYIEEFPDFKKKCKLLSSNSYKDMMDFDIDLVIGVNSFTESTLPVQVDYFENVIKKAKFTYLCRQINQENTRTDHEYCIQLLSDNFLVDDSERIEICQDNIIVYIKQEYYNDI